MPVIPAILLGRETQFFTPSGLYRIFGGRMSPLEERLLDLLYGERGWISTDRAVETVYGDDPNGGPLYASQNISHLVRALRRKGFVVEIQRHLGYRLR